MASKTSRTLVWIILGLVMVGLVGFGSTNFGRSASSIGKVGDTEIDANRYFRELQATLRAFQAQTGQALPIAQAQAFGLTAQALERVITATALDDENARLGISIGDERLRQQLFAIQAFQDLSGKFSRDQYENALRNAGLTPKEYEAQLRADLARGLLQAAVAGGVAAPDTFTDTLFSFARETRDFTWSKLDIAALDEQPAEPTEAELEAYYQANAQDFTLPEVKHLTVAWLKPENLLDQVQLAEGALQKEYEARADQYNKPERRLVERLVFATEEEAQAAMDAIRSGATTFEKLVEDRGLALSDVDLGDVTRDSLGDAGDAVFGLSEPGIVGPAPSTLGPAIFRVNAILAAQHTPIEDVIDELRAQLAGDAARRMVADRISKMDDLLAGGATLEELAQETPGMEVTTLEWTPDTTGGITGYEAFQERVASVSEGDFPELDVLADGGVFGLRVDRVEAPRLQDLDEVRDQVMTAVKHEKALDKLEEQARALIPRLTGDGESLSSLGLTEVSEAGQTRGDLIEGTPPELIQTVFDMQPGDWQVIRDSDGVILVRLDRIVPADHSTDEAKAAKAAFGERVAQEIGIDLESAYARAIQDRAGIALDQAVINAVERQFP